MKNDELKCLLVYDNLPVLQQVEFLLKNNKIQFIVQSFEDSAYDGLYTLSQGKGRIMIFSGDLDKAKVLLKKERIL